MDFLEVDARSVGPHGFFCYMSKKKSEGYQRKQAWLKDRFAEGLKLTLLPAPERGFLESIPGEHAWRAVQADGFTFIHCLWVVGKSKGKGHGVALLDRCVDEAKKAKHKGVAMLTSEGNWLAGRRLLESRGFQCVAEAQPFSLMVKTFGKAKAPTLCGDWEKKQARFGKGLTVVRSAQCPYTVDATEKALETAAELGIATRVVELTSAAEVRSDSPSPYGGFGLVLDGRLLSYCYQLSKDLKAMLQQRRG